MNKGRPDGILWIFPTTDTSLAIDFRSGFLCNLCNGIARARILDFISDLDAAVDAGLCQIDSIDGE